VRRGYDQEQVRRCLEDVATLVEDVLRDPLATEERRAGAVTRLMSTRARAAQENGSSKEDWSWSLFILATLVIVGISLIIAISAGGFFVDPLSTGDIVVGGLMGLGGAALLVGGVHARSVPMALFGIFLVSLATLNFLGVPPCRVDCGGAE